MLRKSVISIVIPAYNEAECLKELFFRLKKVFALEKKYRFEVILIDNGSLDTTWSLMQEICADDGKFKAIQLSRNFRMDGGLTAGLDFAQGSACVLMAADLQDPPELISHFLRKWEEGYENVFGIIRNRQGTKLLRKINSKIFYLLAGLATDGKILQNVSDFRLVDKKVYETIRIMDEKNRFVRGLFSWVGFRSIGIEMDREPRFAGNSNADFFKVLDLAVKGILAHSFKPLKAITFFGLILSVFSFFSLVPLIAIWLIKGVPFAGFGTIVSLLLLIVSFLFLTLGVIGEYIGLIYEETKGRPNYVVRSTVGFIGRKPFPKGRVH